MFTDSLVCHEVLHHVRRVWRGTEAASIIAELHEVFAGDIEPTSYVDVAHAASLAHRYDGASIGDLVHLATMERRHCTTILSAARDFDGLPGITRLDPFSIGSWIRARD